MREFLGHEFTETHTRESELGRVETVTITREPRFDDSDREAFYALYQDDLERCPKCGNPRSICSQGDADIFPQRTVCYVDAVREVATRRFHEKHKGAQPDAASGLLPTDGVTIWASPMDLSPDDDFL